jgi:Zn-dependent peptidase ImmA (M78 family)
LVLHANQTFAFSRGQEKKLGFLDPEDSAECQANWFAASLLLPNNVLQRLAKLDDSSVATLALVGEQVVRVRRRDFELDKRNRNYTGDQCPQCFGFQVVRRGIDLVCEACPCVILSD